MEMDLASHLCYADKTILFSSGDSNSITRMMNTLETYERSMEYGQLINKRKSGFIVHPKATDIFIQEMKQITGFTQHQFPLPTLVPIYIGRKRISYFSDMVARLSHRVTGR